MAASLKIFPSYLKNIGNGTVDLDTDLLRVALYRTMSGLSGGAFSAVGSITASEVANGNGYTTGGKTLSAVTVTLSGTNTARADATDTFWSANGGAITSIKAAVVYKSDGTAANRKCICYVELTQTGVISLADTNRLTIQWNSAGLFDII